MSSSAEPRIREFVARVLAEGSAHYRDLPWRRTRDPYAILVSEIMLQQTQVARVVPRWERWMERFPTLDALAAAPLSEVLAEWQGLGYNRRAVALKRLADKVAAARDDAGATGPARLPRDAAELRALPGVGPVTAAGVLAFAWDTPALYLDTNVRSVALHELFADADGVRDSEIEPLLQDALAEAVACGATPRGWYYALLDYGAELKRSVANPSRRSAQHARQSPFEGSRRQKRARLLRAVMRAPGFSADAYAETIAIDVGLADELLAELAEEGFLARETSEPARWRVAD